ncbi:MULTISPECIES: peptidoglycan binding domain-containing protein [Streptacidiphilus]|uniref:Peptidoglycan binding domain-containing protein n=1 Tax=Streptacidiphilus cavernicola TaxID=3342716 RepID=A0ABV6UHH0_9ACTN|nr:peptidoglycan binding domain-containing protein [Streptacidiphilus jeojiense]
MSRESDSPSTPPRPGPDAYPSGTPPYGVSNDPAFSRAGQPGGAPGADADGAPPEEPLTETTLTTRIRINIPGSRPIPPVVVRSPVPGAGKDPAADAEADAAAAGGPRHRSVSASSPVLGVMEDRGSAAAPMPDLPPEWRTQEPGATPAAGDQPEPPSTWFAPRKKTPSATEPAAAAPQAAPPVAPPTPAPAPAPAAPPFEQPVYEPPAYQQPGYAAAPEEETQAVPQLGYEQPGYQPQTPYQQAPYEQPPYEQPGFQPQGGYQQDPYGQQQPRFEQPGTAYPQPGLEQPGYEQPYQGSPYQQPAGPQSSGPLGSGPQPSGRPAGLNGGLAVGGPDTQQRNRPPQEPQGPDPDATAAIPLFRDQAPGAVAASAATQAPPAAPAAPLPQRAPRPAPAGTPAAAPAGRQQSQQTPPPQQSRPQQQESQAQRRTATAPIGDGFAGGTGGAGAPPRKATEGDAPAAATATASSARKPARSGRSRKLLVTGIGLLVMVVGVAYGAGLMLDQTDVPKGTTVLGQNIGGDTRDVAVHTLDGTVGVLAAKPLTLVIGSKQVQLSPSVAGLTIDTTATVQAVAHHSYNPASVLPSLFGGEHPVAPVVKIDDDKLRSALQQLASTGGAGAKEGSIRFDADGNTQITAPQSGQTLNVDAAMALVQQAYRNRAAGIPDKPVTVPVTTTQPKASAAQLKSAAASIGAWAGQHKFTVTVHGVSQLFGNKTFSSSLTLQPDASGKVVPVFDLTKLQDAIGSTFNGLTTKQGSTVTTKDIATALTQLLSKPGGDRTISL